MTHPEISVFSVKEYFFLCVNLCMENSYINIKHTNLGEFLDGHTKIHRKNVILGMLVIYGHTSTYPLVI